jgi:hypothetical protein
MGEFPWDLLGWVGIRSPMYSELWNVSKTLGWNTSCVCLHWWIGKQGIRCLAWNGTLSLNKNLGHDEHEQEPAREDPADTSGVNQQWGVHCMVVVGVQGKATPLARVTAEQILPTHALNAPTAGFPLFRSHKLSLPAPSSFLSHLCLSI